MTNVKCLTCGVGVSSASRYHLHNVNCHNAEELSSTLVGMLFQDKQNCIQHNMETSKPGGSGTGIFQELMDEVIELGTMEGEDNLTIQSLFLKSNFAPNSRHVIEVQEKKTSKDVIKALSEKFNAAVVNFQNDCLSTEMPACHSRLLTSPKKNTESKLDNTPTKKRGRGRTKNILPSKRKDVRSDTSKTDVKDLKGSSVERKSNVKIVLRSGRTIKTNPKYEDFIYYDDIKENSLKNTSENSVTASVTSNVTDNLEIDRVSNFNEPGIPLSQSRKDRYAADLFSTRLLDLFPDDFNIDDLNLSSELDIIIEDLDLPGFDDLEGTLPENQILTIENLLQELDGGGSIEISNIIRENNIDSDTVVLDALSQNLNKDDLLPTDKISINFLNEKSPRLNSKLKKGQTSKYFCKICKKSYVSKINFVNHTLSYHNNTESNKMLYKCSTCDCVFTFLAAFERHIKNHNPQQTFLCEICGRNFKNLINLKLHTALHKKNVTYQCNLCPNKYFLKYTYLHHLKTHENKNKFFCEKCDKTFTQKHHYNKHMENHSTGKYLYRSNDLKCNYCNDIKPNSDNSEDYFDNCTKCNKGIYKKYLVENENYIESENKESSDRKECKICGKKVKNFKKHVRETHLSNPVVECDICGQSVKKACLKSHKLRRHKGIETECDHCHKTFKNALALKEHLNKVKKQMV